MKSIPTSTLMPDTYFSEPVYLDENYILLSPNIPVTQELINRLKTWRIDQVYTDGTAIGKSEYASLTKNETLSLTLDQDIKEKVEHERVIKFYFDLLNFTKNLFSTYSIKNFMDINSITEKVKDTIKVLKSSKDFILRYNEAKYPIENYLIAHSVNSMILSLSIASILKLPPHKQIDLGISALLHDIGMLKLPTTLYLSSRALTPEEKKKIITHTIIGYKIMKNLSLNEDIALGALEHHERMDGSGYPRALKAGNIGTFGRIIAIGCSFDALTAERPFKESLDGHHGLVDLLKNNKIKYDDQMLKALVISISLYPYGTYVLLSNKSKGMVVKTNPKNPKFPIVKILVDKNGRLMTEPVLVQTSNESGITIWRALEDYEIPKLIGEKKE